MDSDNSEILGLRINNDYLNKAAHVYLLSLQVNDERFVIEHGNDLDTAALKLWEFLSALPEQKRTALLRMAFLEPLAKAAQEDGLPKTAGGSADA